MFLTYIEEVGIYTFTSGTSQQCLLAWPVDLTSHILPQTRLYGRQKSFEGYQRKSFSDGEHKKLFFEVIKELNQKVSNKPIGECMLVGG